jgi:hypothetical protein
MIVTTYTCDKCGHLQENDEQMWDVEIACSHRPSTYTRRRVVKKALWCRPCVVQYHLLPAAKEDKPAPTPPPTFEDMIREIVQEEMNS